MPGYFIYCRKSSEAEDRQVLSNDSQKSELQAVAAKLGLPVLEILEESMTAKEPGRPIFNRMMERLYRGEAAGVICWKLDRLARNPVDGGAITWSIKRDGIKVITPGQSFSREDDNIILMYIEFGMAQKYIDDLGRNVKRGLRAKAERGLFPSLAPQGYLNDKTKQQGERDVLRDPERFPLVRSMWDMMLTGLHTPPQIVQIANEEWGYRTRQTKKTGGQPLSRSNIYNIFTNPFYYGSFEYPLGSGQWYQGSHEPMITKAEYDRVQILLGRKGNPRPSTPLVFPFTGLIRCGECDMMITAEEKHQVICGQCLFKFAYRKCDACPRCQTTIEKMSNPTFRHYTYYHCTKGKQRRCTQKSISKKEIEEQIDALLGRIQISERFKEWALKYLHELHIKESSTRRDIIQAQQKAYKQCVSRIDGLVRLKTSPGNADGSLLSDEEYGRQRSALLQEKAGLEELLRDAGHQVEQWLVLTEKTFEFACTARDRFAKGDYLVKKEILTALASNLTLKDKKLSIEARKPFFILETSLPSSNTEIEDIEPEKNVVFTGRKVPCGPLRPNLCAFRDDVRTYGPEMKEMVASIYHFFRSSGAAQYEIFPGSSHGHSLDDQRN